MDEVSPLLRCRDCHLERSCERPFNERVAARLEQYRGGLANESFWVMWQAEMVAIYLEEGFCNSHAALFAAHSVMAAKTTDQNRRGDRPPAVLV